MNPATDLWPPERPWVVSASEAEILAVERATPQGWQTIRLSGCRLESADRLFEEFNREFRFPEYFGRNWAAFSECMRDLTWLPAVGYLLIIRDADRLLCHDRSEIATFMRTMNTVGSEWSRAVGLGPQWGGGEVPFKTCLVADPSVLSDPTGFLSQVERLG